MNLKKIVKDNFIFASILAFGALSFLGGTLFTRLQFKNKDSAVELRSHEQEDRIYSTISDIANNTELSVELIQGLVSTYCSSDQDPTVQSEAVRNFLEKNTGRMQDIESGRKLSEIAIKDVREHLPKDLMQRRTIESMYSISERINDLAPQLLSALQSNAVVRKSVAGTEKTELTEQELPVAAEITGKQERISPQAVPAGSDTNFIETASLKKGLSLSSVERSLGVPLAKKRDSAGFEIWSYPCGRKGSHNCVYFKNGVVSHWKTQRTASSQ